MSFLSKKPKNDRLNIRDRYDRGEAWCIPIDPGDGSQIIEPEAGQLLTIEARGKYRTFLFEPQRDINAPCLDCDLGKDEKFASIVCPRMRCAINNVVASEFVLAGSEWVRKSKDEPIQLDVIEPPKPSRACERPDGSAKVDASRSSSPSGPSQARLDRRAEWESALRELETRARAETLQADEFKRKAKKCDRNVKAIRSKIMELLFGGSEKYESSTPLFDFLPKDKEEEEK